MVRTEIGRIKGGFIGRYAHKGNPSEVACVACAEQPRYDSPAFSIGCNKRDACAGVARAVTLFGDEQAAVGQERESHGAEEILGDDGGLVGVMRRELRAGG